jgi:hypothetical protein
LLTPAHETEKFSGASVQHRQIGTILFQNVAGPAEFIFGRQILRRS